MEEKYYPKVSIIIPVYNGSNFLRDAIESALGQTYKNIEVIVVNDGSKDNKETEKIALSYGSKIKYIYKENGGVSSALNTGIRNMSGEYFSWLSHDDLYSPYKIEKQVSIIQGNKNIVLCSGGLIDENKKRMKHFTKKISRKKINGVQLFDYFLANYSLNGLGFLIPKKVFDECGLFDENMKYLQDLDMWLRICASDYNFTLQKDELVYTRIHAKQQTNTLSFQFLIDRDAMIEKHFNSLVASENKNKFELIRRYYLSSVKSHNKKYICLIKRYLKDNNQFKHIHLRALWFKIYGKCVDIYRKIRQKIMIKNKLRN